jgi:hypothetical protein
VGSPSPRCSITFTPRSGLGYFEGRAADAERRRLQIWSLPVGWDLDRVQDSEHFAEPMNESAPICTRQTWSGPPELLAG